MDLVLQRTVQRVHRHAAEAGDNHSVLLLRKPSGKSLDTNVRLMQSEASSPCDGIKEFRRESEKVLEENSYVSYGYCKEKARFATYSFVKQRPSEISDVCNSATVNS